MAHALPDPVSDLRDTFPRYESGRALVTFGGMGLPYDGRLPYEFAEWARQQLTFNGHELLEVQNNGLHSTGASCPSGGTGTTSYWCYISQYAGSHGFQTQTYVDTATLMADLNNGLALNAQFIELPDGMKDSDWSQMGCFSKHLLKGESSSCP